MKILNRNNIQVLRKFKCFILYFPLDGKVERNSEGKEVRYPVILSNKEKLIARKVCMAFKQMVCGFDLLRANGKSYVCDVNGFSFVKNSHKYYDDCAKILGRAV